MESWNITFKGNPLQLIKPFMQPPTTLNNTKWWLTTAWSTSISHYHMKTTKKK